MSTWTIPEGYELAFYFTLVLLGIKAIFIIYLVYRIKIERRNEEKISLAIFYAVLVLFLAIFIARLNYFVFDFILTRFDMKEYTYSPNIFFWRLGTLIAGIGGAAFLLPVERVILLNKTRGVFSVIIIVMVIIQFFYPIRPGNNDDFSAVSTLGIVSLTAQILAVIVYLWLGIVSPGLRKLIAVMIAGLIIWALGGLMLSANIIIAFLPFISQDAIYALSISLKIVGLFGVFYAGINFRLINKASMEYYRSKKICIVHKGKIKGKPFMCARCNVLYCTTCKDAAVRAENKCWNCGAVLDSSTEISFQVRADDAMFQQFASFKDETKRDSDMDAFRALLKIGSYLLEQRRNNPLGEHAKVLDVLKTAQDRDGEEPTIHEASSIRADSRVEDETQSKKQGKMM
jgi:hypothetical protein